MISHQRMDCVRTVRLSGFATIVTNSHGERTPREFARLCDEHLVRTNNDHVKREYRAVTKSVNEERERWA